MQDQKTWNAVLKHLSGEETKEENAQFMIWMNETEENKTLFRKIKTIWEKPFYEEEYPGFFQKFTPKKIKGFIVNQALGNFVGFVVGLSVTRMFTHHIIERRSIHNLFGLAGRKKIVVNDVPHWVQWTLSVIAGFIALELINHLFASKKHIKVWNYLKGLVNTK
jgi:hypothetical protein